MNAKHELSPVKSRPKSRKYQLVTRKYKCESCHAYFAKPSTLQKHRRVHTDERPFPCHKCSIGFKTVSNLNKHLKSKAHLLLEYRLKEKAAPNTFKMMDKLPNDLDIYSGVLLIRGPDSAEVNSEKGKDYRLSFILYREDFFEILRQIRKHSLVDNQEPSSEEKKKESPEKFEIVKKDRKVLDTNDLPDKLAKVDLETRKRHKSGSTRRELQRHHSQIPHTTLEEEKLTREVKIKLYHKLMRTNSDSFGIVKNGQGTSSPPELDLQAFTQKKIEAAPPINNKPSTDTPHLASLLRSKNPPQNDVKVDTPETQLPQTEPISPPVLSTETEQNQVSNSLKKLIESMQSNSAAPTKHCLDTGQMVMKPPKKRKFDNDDTPPQTETPPAPGHFFNALEFPENNLWMNLLKMNPQLLTLAPFLSGALRRGLPTNGVLNQNVGNQSADKDDNQSIPMKKVVNKRWNCCDRFFKSHGDFLKHQKSKPHCDKNGNFLLSKPQNEKQEGFHSPFQPPNVNACDLAQEMPINLIRQPVEQSELRANYLVKNGSNFGQLFNQCPSSIGSNESDNTYNFPEIKSIKCEFCEGNIKPRFYQAHLLTHKVAGWDRMAKSHLDEDEESSNQTSDSFPNYMSNSRPHVCTVCDKGFRVEGHLMKHFRSKAHLTTAIQKAGFSAEIMEQIPKQNLNNGDLIDKKNGALDIEAIGRLREQSLAGKTQFQ